MIDTNHRGPQLNLRWLRPAAWAGALGFILLPLAAAQVAPGAGINWTGGDFLLAASVIGAVGLALELAVRISRNWSYRGGAALGLATGFLLLWSNASVGYIGDDSPYNLVFFLIVGVAFLGSLASRFRARGMAVTMLAAGIAHAVAGAIGAPQDPVTVPITMVFTAMWLASAWLFRKAARDGADEAAER